MTATVNQATTTATATAGAGSAPLRILHVLDHSIPLHSGYTFRTRSILQQQRALGWETCHITSSKQGAAGPAKESVDGLEFYRTAPSTGMLARLPVFSQLAVIDTLAARLLEVARCGRTSCTRIRRR
jgi:hypothetical protein